MNSDFSNNNVISYLTDFFFSISDLTGYYKVARKFLDKSFIESAVSVWTNFIHPKKMILFYPERPVRSSIVYKLCAALGYKIISNPKNLKAVPFKYKNETFFDIEELKNVLSKNKILNGRNNDISKTKVAEIFSEVFDYSLGVDPENFQGRIVVKSDLNALHKGDVVQGPLSADVINAEMVYQKEIDNRTGDGLILDYRVPVHGDKIPLVYLKYRPIESRFSNTNNFVEMKETHEIFSEEEINRIIVFAEKMGIDFGEFDILRDKDGKIYIVDVNSSPWGPPNGLPENDQKKAVEILSRSFKALIEKYYI